jgi:hypothetical protein
MKNYYERLQTFFPVVKTADFDYELRWYYFKIFTRSLLDIFPNEMEKVLQRHIRKAFNKLKLKRKELVIKTSCEFEKLIADCIFESLSVNDVSLKDRFLKLTRRRFSTRQALCDRHANKFIEQVLPNMKYIFRDETLIFKILNESLKETDQLFSLYDSEKDYIGRAMGCVVDNAYKNKFFIIGDDLRGEIPY